MKPSILVIDTNPAVQALASAALSKAGAQVEVLSDGEKAWVRISTTKPRIVFCAHDVPGLNPIQLCERIRREKALRQTVFVLLAPSDQRREVVSKMQGTVIDKILYKPFKSDQLRLLVETLLNASPEEPPRTCALLIEDTFSRRVFEKTVSKRNVTSLHFNTADSLLRATPPAPFIGAVIDAKFLRELTWPTPKGLGQVVVLFSSEEEQKAAALPPGAGALCRPLSLKKLEQALNGMLPAAAPQSREQRPLEIAEQAQLAARISAAVFERLLTQEALRVRNWEEAFAALSPEVLKVCKDFSE